VLMVSFLKGSAPIMAVEVARRAVPGHVGRHLKNSKPRAVAEAPLLPPHPPEA